MKKKNGEFTLFKFLQNIIKICEVNVNIKNASASVSIK